MSVDTAESFFVVSIGFIAGGILKGATGIGSPIIAVPILAIYFDARFAIIMFSIPNIIPNLWQAWSYRKTALNNAFLVRFAEAAKLEQKKARGSKEKPGRSILSRRSKRSIHRRGWRARGVALDEALDVAQHDAPLARVFGDGATQSWTHREAAEAGALPALAAVLHLRPTRFDASATGLTERVGILNPRF